MSYKMPIEVRDVYYLLRGMFPDLNLSVQPGTYQAQFFIDDEPRKWICALSIRKDAQLVIRGQHEDTGNIREDIFDVRSVDDILLHRDELSKAVSIVTDL